MSDANTRVSALMDAVKALLPAAETLKGLPTWADGREEVAEARRRFVDLAGAAAALGLPRPPQGGEGQPWSEWCYELDLWITEAVGRLGVAGGALPEGPGTGPAAYVPTPADLTILTVLDEAGGGALKQAAIIIEANKLTRGAGRRPGLEPVSDTVLRERLPLLPGAGYVARPTNTGGKPAARKGVGITNEGRQLLRAARGT